jgi:pimeloyl-ACP methyl ester carboxylesterase
MLLGLAAGCAGLPETGMTRVHSGEFELAQQDFSGRPRGSGPIPARRLILVIEGDGPAWPAADRAPSDPTPGVSSARALARSLQVRWGEGSDVIYLGRPCQYGGTHRGAPCDPRWWTTDRYAQPVIAAYAAWLDVFALNREPRSLCLVGVSGGGLIAMLLAEQRPEVTGVMTIASPLAIDAWTAHHGLSPVDRGPAVRRGMERLGASRQLHFLGARDAVVPPEAVLADTQRAVDASRIKVLAGVGHAGPWDGARTTAGEPGPLTTPISAWCADGNH